MTTRAGTVLLVCLLTLAVCRARAGDASPHPLTAADQKNHAALMKRLTPDQIQSLSAVYPDFRLLTACPGRFSGASPDEWVLGVWKPVTSDHGWTSEVHRVGLLWIEGKWRVHVIDDEIAKDAGVSHSFPMSWQYAFDEKGFHAETKCGVDGEFRKDSDLTTEMGDQPLFDLKKAGLENHKVACFATSDVYNNWDCVVYSPKDGRFKLWFQQAHAD